MRTLPVFSFAKPSVKHATLSAGISLNLGPWVAMGVGMGAKHSLWVAQYFPVSWFVHGGYSSLGVMAGPHLGYTIST